MNAIPSVASALGQCPPKNVDLVAFDLETYLIEPGLLAPPMVCGSWSFGKNTDVCSPGHAIELIDALLRSNFTIAGANIAYDFGVVAAYRPELVPAIFAKYDRGEVHDVLIAQMLDYIARGYVTKQGIIDPSTGAILQRWSKTGKLINADRFSLETVTYLCTGRRDAKANDAWRLRYGELADVPMGEWPPEAIQYPKDDARNTYEVAAYQRDPANGFKNQEHLAFECRAAFAMHLASIWGFRTNGESVAALRTAIETAAVQVQERFGALGFIKPDGKEDAVAIKRAVACAYAGVSMLELEACPECDGHGKVVSPKSGNDIQCKACSATGYEIPDGVPKTDAGGVSKDRDTLKESGDEDLEDYGNVSMLAKLRDTYLPFLESGVKQPINLQANVLLATGRASYEGLIQLLPRDIPADLKKLGADGVRPCFEARPGYLYCSVDYGGQELVTLAQVLNDTLSAPSSMANALNEKKDLHTEFAANMLGERYDVLRAKVKSGNKDAKAKRQMAKAANFGFPGGMGAVTLVRTKRKEGLRFCLLNGYTKCGEEKITKYGRQEFSPTCKACIEVAENLRKQWFRQWPEMKVYFELVSEALEMVEKGGAFVSSISGFLRGAPTFSSMANHMFQHLASRVSKDALWNVSKECYLGGDDLTSPLFGSRVVAFLHDELLLEVLEDRAHEAAHRVSDLMVQASKRWCPDIYVEAPPALMRRWYKDAEPVYVDGRLVPWTPSGVRVPPTQVVNK